MTFVEYEKYLIANMYKDAKQKDSERQLLATIMNFGGMGIEKYIEPSKLVPIPLYDVDDITLPIRSVEEAMKVFRLVIE